MRVNVAGKPTPVSFLRVEGRGALVGAKDRREREGQIEELVGGQNQGPVAPPRARKGKRRGGKGDVRRGATARGAMEDGCVKVIEREEVRGDDPVEYFFPAGVGSNSGVPKRVMAIEVSQNEEILEEGRMEGEKESVLPSVGEEQIGGVYTLRNDTKEELFREMLILT